MKQTATIFLMLIAIISFGQIPNAGFESWTNGAPTGWSGNNNIVSGQVIQSNDAYQGNFSAELDVVSASGNNYGGSIATTFPLTGVPDSLCGYYMGHFVGSDAFYLECSVQSAHYTVATLFDSIKTEATIYTRFAFKIDTIGLSTGNDTGFITLLLHNPFGSLIPGTTVNIDDLSFSSLGTGINSINENIFQLRCVPNPATNIANIMFSINSNSSVNLELYDVTGQQLKTLADNIKLGNGQYKIPVDVSGLGNGIYLYKLMVNGESYTQKMIVAK